ncbi:MAG: hypothetical protein CVU81_02270 [Euryarchaeota archaeon HGW-Euryarchaeota-1]|nr:MAG: hypothetical protein CVU81_02270 [Euryarchaeota archaeon HGW-Euryarchaeota-1]
MKKKDTKNKGAELYKYVPYIIIFILLPILIFYFINYNELTSDYQTLQNSSNTITTNYNNLYGEYALLNSTHKNLKYNYDTLYAQHQTLQEKVLKLQEDVGEKSGSYQQLAIENTNLKLELAILRSKIEAINKIPHAYYEVAENKFPKHQNSVEDLQWFLNYEFKMPKNYKRDLFDCSEMSAYLEWCLEGAGFTAKIVTGEAPWNTTTGYHAWVIVNDLTQGNTTGITAAIESTTNPPELIYSNNPNKDNYYYGYDKTYNNIYTIATSNYNQYITEFNWWESYWGFV